MYRLFDEGGISLEEYNCVADRLSDSFENVVVKSEHPQAEVGMGIIETCDNYAEKMVVQENQVQSYSDLLQMVTQELLPVEELRPRSISPSGNLQMHYHLHHQRQQQNYYNLTPINESSCSTVFFSDLESIAGPVVHPPSSSGTESASAAKDISPPVLSTGLIIDSKASLGTNNNNINNPSASEAPYHHQHYVESISVVIPEQAHGITTSSSTRHYIHHLHSKSSSLSHEEQNTDADRSSVDELHFHKKRKVFSHDGNETLDDQEEDAKSIHLNDDSKKQNHSEIEKRRRDKMNTYIMELAAMVPMCHAMSRKLDKLTVLRMAVQHLKTILGAVTSYTEGHYKPSFLTDQELKTLIVQAAEGFVFVVGCDRGRILYVSKSVSQILNYSQGDLLGQSWFDILHPKDVAKVKEQLSSSDLSPRERLIDAKTMLPVKTDVPRGTSKFCPGARRSFFCRMKRKIAVSCTESKVKKEADTTTGYHGRKKQQNHEWKYCVIQCTGYLKSWGPAKIGLEEHETEVEGETYNLSCLVAVGRVQLPLIAPPPTPQRLKLRAIEFVSRHATDGKFLFVDQRATSILGFLPQELLGTSMYEYYHHDDIPHLAESHKAVLQSPERITTQVYRFRSKGASFIRFFSEWKSFKNPWTKDIEYLIAKNSAIFSDTGQVDSSANRTEESNIQENYDFFTQSNRGLERLISSHVEVSKIGRQIAEKVLDLQRRNDQDSSSNNSSTSASELPLQNTEITTTASPEQVLEVHQAIDNDSSSSNHTTIYNHINNNVEINIIATNQGSSGEQDIMEMIESTSITESQNLVPNEGNDEAAMAVIMSLLEADAGLGEQVDFSGLPWPLP